MEILKFILGLFTGSSATAAVGNVISTGTQLAAIVAALVPLGLWFSANKNEVFITLTYADLAFWGTIMGSWVLVTVRLVHRAPGP